MGADYQTKQKEIQVAQEKKEWHTPDGKFKKGNPGGGGKAALYKDKIRYNDLLRKCVTDDEFKKVAAKLLEKAQEGEGWAIRELMDRLMGKPKQVAEVDITQNNIDPKTVINNIAILLGVSDDGEEFIQLDGSEPEKIDAKEQD